MTELSELIQAYKMIVPQESSRYRNAFPTKLWTINMSFKYTIEESTIKARCRRFLHQISLDRLSWNNVDTIGKTHMNTPDHIKFQSLHTLVKMFLRGLHGDNETWKHITCVYGAFYLVVVDYRKDSPRYLQWDSFTLDEIVKVYWSHQVF